jgi:hypothetical protein
METELNKNPLLGDLYELKKKALRGGEVPPPVRHLVSALNLLKPTV